MRDRWASRPYVTRIQLAGALLVSVGTEVVVLVFFVGARRFHPSSELNLCIFTFTIAVLGLGTGAIQGYRVVRQARSALDAGEKDVALTLVSRQFFLTLAMAGLGCTAIIVSIMFLIELITRK